MAIDFIAAAKVLLPYVADIASATIPVLTRRKGKQEAADIAQQIAELQAAATHNAEAIKVLAEQTQKTVQALEQGAVEMQRRMRFAYGVAFVAVAVAIGSLVIALIALNR